MHKSVLNMYKYRYVTSMFSVYRVSYFVLTIISRISFNAIDSKMVSNIVRGPTRAPCQSLHGAREFGSDVHCVVSIISFIVKKKQVSKF